MISFNLNYLPQTVSKYSHRSIWGGRSSSPGYFSLDPLFQGVCAHFLLFRWSKNLVSGASKINQGNNKYTLKKCVIEIESGSLRNLSPNIRSWKLCNIKHTGLWKSWAKFIMSTHIPTACIHTWYFILVLLHIYPSSIHSSTSFYLYACQGKLPTLILKHWTKVQSFFF